MCVMLCSSSRLYISSLRRYTTSIAISMLVWFCWWCPKPPRWAMMLPSTQRKTSSPSPAPSSSSDLSVIPTCDGKEQLAHINLFCHALFRHAGSKERRRWCWFCVDQDAKPQTVTAQCVILSILPLFYLFIGPWNKIIIYFPDKTWENA